ncbi:TPA: hypothetical protein ACGQLE_005349, partial [Escherichia coli]
MSFRSTERQTPFSGEPAQIAEIKRLASGAVTPLYRRATNEGIQLFL